MSKVTFHSSFEDMQEAIVKAREEAAPFIEPFQRAAKAGDFYIHFNAEYELIVYGEILDPVETDRAVGSDPEELEYLAQLYAQPHMADYRFARAYSPLCKDGELGDIHLTGIGKTISQAQFEQFKALNWPQMADRAAIREILGQS
jgi:hypothetical protein